MNKLLLLLLAIFFSITLPVHSQELVINEILSNNKSGIQDAYGDNSDWIEIHNTGDAVINLQGYYLSDDEIDPLKWQFPNYSIAPFGYVLVFASGNETVNNELHANFKLSAEGEDLFLSAPNGSLIDKIDSIPHRADVSYGHKPNGSGILKYFASPTPGSSNNSTGYDGFLPEPLLDIPGGFYAESVSVEASHDDVDVVIRYTLDGSEPTDNSSIYYDSFNFDNVASDPNGISMIPTNPSFNYPEPGFDEDRADSRGWLEPYTVINKANILKIKAFKTNHLPSNAITETYFVNPEADDRYTLPVISISTDPDGFFSDVTGMYVYGVSGDLGNYYESGREWERPLTFELFEDDGTLVLKQNLGVRTHGAGGRHSTLKNLRMYAREEYGKSTLKYDWFGDEDNDTFKRFLVRGPGHRPDCMPRDDFADLLIENLDMDIQHVQHVIVFLNGEYWGIHTVKERFDQDYLEIKYGKDDDDYVILKSSGKLHSGEEEDVEIYDNLLEFVGTNDMSLDENYEYVKTQIDIDNYLNYFNFEVFVGNADWVNTNIKFWRYKGLDKSKTDLNPLDGRWRWFMFDFDVAFGGSCNEINYSVNILDNSFDPSYGRSTELARGLKQNEQWRFDMINKMCDLMNSTFVPQRFNEKIEEIDNIMRPELMEHTERWRYPSLSETLNARQYEIPTMDRWNETIDGLRIFRDNRKRKIIGHLQAEFDVADTISIILNVNDIAMGNIKINSIVVSEDLDGIYGDVYPWHGTYFEDVYFPLQAIPKLGYRFVEWQETGDTDASMMVDLDEGATFTAVFEEDPDFIFEDILYINEFMASNKTTIKDEFDAAADWIEIYNPNNIAIDIGNYYISDDAEDQFKYQFPAGTEETVIPAYGYKLIWADDRTERGVLHTNFKLEAKGEDIVFTAPDLTLIDNVTFGKQEEDISLGREKDGDAAWKFFEKPIGPTPGKTNNNAPTDDLVSSSVIQLYPNPVSQGRTVYFSNVMNIQVYNSVGQILMTKQQVTKLETSEFQAGIYFIKTENRGILKLLVE